MGITNSLKAVSQYLSQLIGIDPPQPQEEPAPELYFITYYTANIQDFFTDDSKSDPLESVAALEHYRGVLNSVIEQECGSIDMFQGDAFYAYWGAPLRCPPEEGAKRACRAILRQKEALDNYNKTASSKLILNVGVASGDVAMGIVGGERRKQYMALGRPVNLSRELVSGCKSRGTSALVSETTYELCKDDFIFEQTEDFQRIEDGKRMKVYILTGFRRQLSDSNVVV